MGADVGVGAGARARAGLGELGQGGEAGEVHTAGDVGTRERSVVGIDRGGDMAETKQSRPLQARGMV